MNHASLFSGQGGFDLAAQWMGWNNEFHCEWNPFLQHLLKYYWPNAITYGNIKTTDFTVHRRNIDVLSGGFPCQPYSTAGKQKGNEDERHLWPEMLRAIREIQPTWVLGENVRGLVSWNEGLVFHEVQSDLEAEGYEVFPFLLPAASVNAPHERYRIWFVAYSHSFRQYRRQFEDEKHTGERREHAQRDIIQGFHNGFASHTGEQGFQNAKQEPTSEQGWWEERGTTTEPYTSQNWDRWPTQSPVCSRNDGLSARLDIASIFSGITKGRRNPFTRWREESIKAGGNAIVPQLATQIFRSIQEYDKIYP